MDNIIVFNTTFLQKKALLCGVRVRVVPLKLHSVLFAAYHGSAGNGHASFQAYF
jgi:hypothetical protein